MAVTVDYSFGLETAESVAAAGAATSTSIKFSNYEISGRLDANSTPDAEKVSYFPLTLVGASSGTIDFTSLAGPLSTTITALGLKLRAIRVSSLATSVGNLVLAEGVSNGYAGVAATIGPGETFMHYYNDRLAAVAAGDKTIDYTHSAAVNAQVTLIFG